MQLTLAIHEGSKTGKLFTLYNNNLSVVISLSRTAAAFNVNSSVAPSGSGSVSCTPNPVPLGQASTCTAQANKGWGFSGWTSANCAQTLRATCTLHNVAGNETVAAAFSPKITAEVFPPGAGTVKCTPNPAPKFVPTTCTATPNNGYALILWTGACLGDTDQACELSSVTKPETTTATFALVNPGGPVSTSGGVPGTTIQSTSGWAYTSGTNAKHQTLGWTPVGGSGSNSPPPPPGSVQLLYGGLFDFVLKGGTPGSSADVTIHYPNPLPPNTEYWKYNRATKQWSQLAAGGYTVSGSTITLHLTDGGTGDSDGKANGYIVDPGGPAVPTNGGGGQAKPIPTLDELGLGLLAGLLGLLVLGWHWRRRA